MGKYTAQDETGTKGRGMDAEHPILIVGSTRSGSTLLSLMVRNHPRIAFAGELEWVWDFDFEEEPDLKKRPPDEYLEWLLVQRHFQHHHLQIDPSLPFGRLVRDLVYQMREDAEPGCQKPWVSWTMHRHLEQALRIWPRARVVHLVRDGRDVCSSWLRLGWLGSGYDAGLRWSQELERWRHAKAHMAPGQSMEMRFERLITDPARELRRLCAFIGESYEPSMLTYPETSTYGPVDPGQARKWPGELALHDVRLFETVAGDELVRQGYGLSGNSSFPMHPAIEPLLMVEAKLRHHRALARTFGPGLHFADVLARRMGPRWLRDRVQLELNAIESANLK